MILFKKIRAAANLLVFLSLILFFEACTGPVWHRADIAMRRDGPEAAEQVLQARIRKNPKDAEAYYRLAQVRAKLAQDHAEAKRWRESGEKWTQAAEAFTKSEELNNRLRSIVIQRKDFYWKQNMRLGLAELKKSQFEQAAEFFNIATIISPTEALGYRLSGEAFWGLADSLESRRRFFTKLNDPSRAAILGEKAQAALQNSRIAFQNVLQHDYKDHRARRFLIKIYFDTGAFHEAIKEADTMLRLKPNDKEAMRIRAYSFDKLDRREEATKAYRALVEKEPLSEDLESFAAFNYRHGAYNNSVLLSQKSIQAGGERATNMEAIAQSRLMQQNFPQLFSTANAIIADDQWNVNALMLRQASELSLGQLDAANKTAYEYMKAVAQARLMAKKYPALLQSADDLLKADSSNVHHLRLRYIALDSLGYEEAFKARLRFLYAYTDSLRGEKDFLGMVETTNVVLGLDSTNRTAANMQIMAYDSLALPQKADQAQINLWLAIAGKAFSEKRFQQTLTRLDSVLNLDQLDHRALKMRYVSYDSLNLPQKAREAEVIYINALAGEDFTRKDYQEHLRIADELLKINNINRDAVELKINALLGLNRKEEAIQTRIRFLFSYAASLKAVESYSEVLQTANQILEIEKQNLRALKLRMDAYDLLSQNTAARSAEIEFRLALSDSLKKASDYKGVLAEADNIIAINPVHLQALEMRFNALTALELPEESKKAELKYLTQVSEKYEKEQKNRELIKTTTRILEIDRTNKQAADRKIAAHQSLGQSRLAEETKFEYWYAMAQSYFDLENYDQVHKYVDEILSVNPEHLPALKMKRAAFHSRGFIDEALAILKKIEMLSGEK